MHSSFMGSVDILEFHTVEPYSHLRLTRDKYNIKELSRVGKE